MRAIIPLLGLMCLSAAGSAQCGRTIATTSLFGNDIVAPITTGGNLFWDGDDRSFRRYSDEGQPATLLVEGLWLGGRAPDSVLRVAAALLGVVTNEEDYYPGPLPPNGALPQYDCAGWNRTFSVRRFEIEQHQADFADNGIVDAPLPVILEWPAKGNPHFEERTGLGLPNDEHGLAPYRDVNQNGIYDPLMGDYPALEGIETLPAQLVWNVFNDLNGPHEISGAPPLGVEVHRTVWVFGCANSPLLNQSVFVRYNIINRSTAPIEEMRMGLFVDFDIGCYQDDFIGMAPELNAFFGYNGTAQDQQPCMAWAGPSFQGSPPVQSAIILDQPLAAAHYFTNSDQPILPVTFPGDSLAMYRLMGGFFPDGTPITAGGTGYDSGGPVTPFAFPGFPADSGAWAMPNTELAPDDFNSVGGIAIGTLSPGEAFEATTARVYTSTAGLSFSEGFERMYEDLAQMQVLYNQQFEGACATPSCAVDCVWPGDANNDGTANHEDLLAIGLHLGQTGPPRALPPAWSPQASEAWALPGQRFADANGNGSIRPEDILVTLLNYGNTREGYTPAQVYPEGPELQAANLIGGAFGLFSTSEYHVARIQLDAPPKLKGLAFELEYDPRYVELSVYDNPAPITDTRISIARHAPDAAALQYADFQLGDENQWISSEPVFKPFYLRTYDSYTEPLPSDTTYLRFRNITAVKPDGALLDLGGMDAMVVFEGLPIVKTREAPLSQLSVFPNPTDGQLRLHAPGRSWETVRLISPTGQALLQRQGHFAESLELDLSGYPAGLYWLQLKNQEQTLSRKVVLTK